MIGIQMKRKEDTIVILYMHFIPNVALIASFQIETADPHACIDRRAFPANIAHSPNVG